MLRPIDNALRVLNSPAALQLNRFNIFDVARIADSTKPFGFRYEIGYAYNTFHHKYDSLGQPTQCTNFAITNGSIAGQRQHTVAGNLIPDGLHYAYHHKTYIDEKFTLPLLGCIYRPGFEVTASSEFDLNALPNVQNQLIYRSNIRFKLKIYTCLFAYDMIDIHPVNRWINSTPHAKARDNGPGGFMRTDEFLGDALNSAQSAGMNFTLNVPDRFCFVPTYSALDISTEDIYFDFSDNTNSSRQTIMVNTNDTTQNVYIYIPASNTISSFGFITATNIATTNSVRWNEQHARPTIHSGSGIFVALLAGNRFFRSDSVGQINSVEYNFGKYRIGNLSASTSTFIYDSVYVTNTGTMRINGNSGLGFSTDNNFPPDTGSVFILGTRGAVCNARHNILVDNWCNLVLGSQQGNRSGILEVLDNSVLTLRQNSNVVLNKSSKNSNEVGQSSYFTSRCKYNTS